MSACVYRMLDADGTVIYVGRTTNPSVRMRSHKCRSAWWPDVARIEYDECASYDHAVEFEKRQIALHKPRHNDQYADTVDPETEHVVGYPVSYTTFNNKKCRCDGCRAAKAEYVRTQPSKIATSRARSAAAKWVRDNHPAVWQQIIDAEYERTGATRRSSSGGVPPRRPTLRTAGSLPAVANLDGGSSGCPPAPLPVVEEPRQNGAA